MPGSSAPTPPDPAVGDRLHLRRSLGRVRLRLWHFGRQCVEPGGCNPRDGQPACPATSPGPLAVNDGHRTLKLTHRQVHTAYTAEASRREAYTTPRAGLSSVREGRVRTHLVGLPFADLARRSALRDQLACGPAAAYGGPSPHRGWLLGIAKSCRPTGPRPSTDGRSGRPTKCGATAPLGV